MDGGNRGRNSRVRAGRRRNSRVCADRRDDRVSGGSLGGRSHRAHRGGNDNVSGDVGLAGAVRN